MELADLTRIVFVILHFIGLASLLGGFLVQMKALRAGTARVIPAMIHGAWTAFITGLGLVAIYQWRVAENLTSFEIDHTKIAVKSIIATLIVVLVMLYRKKDPVRSSVVGGIGGLTLLNVILAVAW